MKTFVRLALVAAAVSLSGCGVSVCDRNAQVDLGKKSGDCGAPASNNLLGDKSSCSGKVSPCAKADQDLLVKALDCVDKLAVCASATRDGWAASERACYAPLSGLSKGCSDSLFGGVIPGEDGGADASVDAGPEPLEDGGHGVFLVGVADETTFAFAWTTLQPGTPARWALAARGDGGATSELAVEPGTRIDFMIADAGPGARFHLVGYDSTGALVLGNPDAGSVQVDAGPSACQGPLDCPPDRVCDLNQCRAQSCQTGSSTCPSGYDCLASTCYRSFSDGGTFDAGAADASVSNQPLQFISNPVALVRGAPGVGPTVPMGGFPGRRADLVAIDTARVFVAMEQEGQLIGHASSRRGLDYVQDMGTTSNIDTVGNRVKATYNAESQTIFVCYNVGRGIRVRRSTDFGRTWGTTATTIDPVDDGGLTAKINDCDIAPWKSGGALMVTVESDSLAVRTVSPALSVGDPEAAFLASPPDAGNIQNPVRPAIATLPADSIVHVVFTGTRVLGTMVSDTEPFGVYRDGSLGGFTQPKFLNPGVATPGTSYPQDWTTVAVDPISKKAIAAFTSLEMSPSGGATVATVYTSLWGTVSSYCPTGRCWSTGTDLNVFALASDNNTTILFPTKLKNDLWDAFSPNLSVSPAGKMFLSFAAGPRVATAGDYRLYLVPFDFELQSPVSTSKGWYVTPVRQLSTTRVFNPGSVSTVPPPTITSFGADSQISVYSSFVEGTGNNGEIEGRVMYTPRP